jgi:hypothetical protein
MKISLKDSANGVRPIGLNKTSIANRSAVSKMDFILPKCLGNATVNLVGALQNGFGVRIQVHVLAEGNALLTCGSFH